MMACRACVDIRGPTIQDRLPFQIGHKRDLSLRKGALNELVELRCRRIKCSNVIHLLRKGFAGCCLKLKKCADRIWHRHEWNACILSHKALVRLALCSVVQHFGSIIACASGRERRGANQAGKPKGTGIDLTCRRLGIQLAIKVGIVVPQLLKIQLVDAVHGTRRAPLRFLDFRNLSFHGKTRKPVHCNGRLCRNCVPWKDSPECSHSEYHRRWCGYTSVGANRPAGAGLSRR